MVFPVIGAVPIFACSLPVQGALLRRTDINKFEENKMKKIHTKGFTLVELMVTLSIIVMLLAVALPSYKYFKEKAMVAQLIQLSGKVVSDLEMYYNQTGSFSGLTLASPEGGPIMAGSVFTGAVAPIIDGISWEIQAQADFTCVCSCYTIDLGIVSWEHCEYTYSIAKTDAATGIEIGFARVIDTGPDDRFGFNVGEPPPGGFSRQVFNP